MYQIIAYIKFLLKSTNQHGVHSPFVYNLLTKCFYDTTKHEAYQALKAYKTTLLSNKKSITITDFGAGSRIFKTNKRAINKIAKTSGITTKRAQLLYRLTVYLQTKLSLELGTSLGIATSALSLGNRDAKIMTIEGCKETAKIAKQQFEAFQLKNIELRIGEFENEIPKLDNTFDLIYIDGNHQKEATLHYFNQLRSKVHNNSVMIFDDIHWSKEMTEAWNIIKQHPEVTVSIDAFFWGFVFFRKEQLKENFTIRV